MSAQIGAPLTVTHGAISARGQGSVTRVNNARGHNVEVGAQEILTLGRRSVLGAASVMDARNAMVLALHLPHLRHLLHLRRHLSETMAPKQKVNGMILAQCSMKCGAQRLLPRAIAAGRKRKRCVMRQCARTAQNKIGRSRRTGHTNCGRRVRSSTSVTQVLAQTRTICSAAVNSRYLQAASQQVIGAAVQISVALPTAIAMPPKRPVVILDHGDVRTPMEEMETAVTQNTRHAALRKAMGRDAALLDMLCVSATTSAAQMDTTFAATSAVKMMLQTASNHQGWCQQFLADLVGMEH